MSTFRKALKAFIETIRTERAPAWVAEPVRKVANRVIGWTALAATVAAVVTNYSSLLPANVRGEVTAVIGTATAVFALITKLAGEILRSKVFSPATHAAELAHAQSASLRGGSAAPNVSESLTLDESLGQGQHLATPAPVADAEAEQNPATIVVQ